MVVLLWRLLIRLFKYPDAYIGDMSLSSLICFGTTLECYTPVVCIIFLFEGGPIGGFCILLRQLSQLAVYIIFKAGAGV